MFDTPFPYRLAQIQKNKFFAESFTRKYIYVFHCKDELSVVKYLAVVKEYEDNLLTIEFYPKIKGENKYKVLTHQYKFSYIGSTVLKIMADIQIQLGISNFGILASSLIEETDNEANKRYRTYVNILQRKVDKQKYKVFGVEENSFIFVLPGTMLDRKEELILKYETIFKETE